MQQEYQLYTLEKEAAMNMTSTSDDILAIVEQYILHLFNQQQDARLVYHNYEDTVATVRLLQQIASQSNYTPQQVEIATLAAWFQNIGYSFDYKDAKNKNVEIARSFLTTRGYEEDKLEEVIKCIEHGGQGKPKNYMQQLLTDTLTARRFSDTYKDRQQLLKLEAELITNQKKDKLEWSNHQIQDLLAAKYYSPYAKRTFEPILAKNILWQKKQLDKIRTSEILPLSNNSLTSKRYQGLEAGDIPLRGIQSFFRSTYRVHINLSAIADNKANIMISVNSILISVLITVLSYRNIAQTNPMILMPVIIFLVTGLVSLIFAVLSARPKVTMLNEKQKDTDEVKKNMIFFGNFVTLKLDQYEDAMDEMFKDSELMYGNMTRDLYYLGKVLDKKYRFLTISYNIFMLGFVCTVLSFLYILLM